MKKQPHPNAQRVPVPAQEPPKRPTFKEVRGFSNFFHSLTTEYFARKGVIL